MIKECTISDSKRRWFADKVLVHEPLLRCYIQRIIPRSQEIDDLLQETYGRLLAIADSEIARIRATGEFVCRTAHNIVLGRLRRERVVSLDALAEMQSQQVLQSLPWFDRTPTARQELALLRRVVTSLPRRCRKIFILCKVHGWTQEKIASHLGLPEWEIEQQIATGIRLCAARMFTVTAEHRSSLFSRFVTQGAKR